METTLKLRSSTTVGVKVRRAPMRTGSVKPALVLTAEVLPVSQFSSASFPCSTDHRDDV